MTLFLIQQMFNFPIATVMFSYIPTDGYKIKSNIVLFKIFLLLEIETFYIPIKIFHLKTELIHNK